MGKIGFAFLLVAQKMLNLVSIALKNKTLPSTYQLLVCEIGQRTFFESMIF